MTPRPLLVLPLVLAACHVPDPWPCPGGAVAGRAALAGRVTWSLGADGGEQAFPAGDEAACTAYAGGGVSIADDLGSAVVGESVGITCTGNGTRLWVDVRLGDPRAWAPGAVPVTEHVRFQYTDSCEKCLVCTQYVDGGAAVEVLEAAGGAASPPDLATADFVRRYRVRFDLAAPVRGFRGTNPNIVDCERTAFLTFDLEFDLDRADFTTDLDRMCHPQG